jgi:hypothetical protein
VDDSLKDDWGIYCPQAEGLWSLHIPSYLGPGVRRDAFTYVLRTNQDSVLPNSRPAKSFLAFYALPRCKNNPSLHPGNRTNANKEKHSVNGNFKFGSPMFEIEAIVTTSTRTQLKLTANWPLMWLQKLGYIQIERDLLPNEIVPPLNSFVERSELSVDRELLWNLQLGDRVLIHCFLKGEPLESAMARPDTNSGNVIDFQEAFRRSVTATG